MAGEPPIRTVPIPAAQVREEVARAPMSGSVVVPTVASPSPAGSPSPPAASVDLPKRCSACEHRYPADFLLCPRDGTPLVADGEAEDPLLGRVLGETYQVVRLLGEGGMGRVYEARHLRLRDRRLAVKLLQPEYVRDAEIVTRFQREAESASSIAHPNVVEVFDVSKTADGTPYIVTELLTGEELGLRIEREGRLPVPLATRIAREICSALIAAHARGVVHRDMKPDNVFLAEESGGLSVKVIDFGISRAGERETNLTRTGVVMGTPSYMAPEQARGERVDERADVYAVGALLYEALTGKRPFPTEDATTTLARVLTEEPERPRSLVPDMPEGLELVIQRAMAKDPRDRFASMKELDQALAPFDSAPTALDTVVHRHQDGTVVATTKAGSDPNARTMMAAHAQAPAASSDARLARPTIVVSSLGLFFWLCFGTMDAAGGLVRHLQGRDVTEVEAILVAVPTLIAALPPTVFFAIWVRKVWPNSVRAVELAADLRRTLVVGLATYGTIGLGLRVAFGLFVRDAEIVAGGAVDAALFGLSVALALVGGGVGPIARAIRRRRD